MSLGSENMDEALRESSDLVPELMADQCLVNRDDAENVVSCIDPYNGPGSHSVLETLTLTNDSPGLSTLDTGPCPAPNALTTTDATDIDTNSPAHVKMTDNDVEQRLDLLGTRDTEDWTTRTTKHTADEFSALVTTDADVSSSVQSIGADKDSSAQVHITDNDVEQRFNLLTTEDAEDWATAMMMNKAGEVIVSQTDLQESPRAQFSPKHRFDQFHEAEKAGQELKKYIPILDVCLEACETYGSPENTNEITRCVQEQKIGHSMPSSISVQMDHAGKMGVDIANAKHSVPHSTPEQTNQDDKKTGMEKMAQR